MINNGYILCVAELADCIYIDKQYVNLIKNENPNNFLYGDYTEGRYSRVLKNVKLLDELIEFGSQLRLWKFREEKVSES